MLMKMDTEYRIQFSYEHISHIKIFGHEIFIIYNINIIYNKLYIILYLFILSVASSIPAHIETVFCISVSSTHLPLF